MKQITKFFTLAIVMLAFAASTFAQVSATANATATIVAPIAIAKVTDLEFGNVAVSTAAGTVVMNATTGARSVTGGCTLPATTGTVNRASFTVTGTAGYTYSITLPAGPTTIGDGVASTMTVTPWTSSPTPTGTLTGGTETLYVGATLNVGASQTPGNYSATASNGSGVFTVTVNYN